MNTLRPCRSTLPVRKFWLMSLALLALTSLTAARAARIDRYVDKANATPSSPYNAWTNAATDIQSAVNAAVAAQGDEVIVRAGVYDTGGVAIVGLTNRVHVDRAITLRSENNDPANTIIQGAWDPVTTNGPAAVRPVYLQASGSRLIGFTLTNGATHVTGESTEARCGGGIHAHSSAIISNCVIVGNMGYGYSGNGGGGALGGTFYDSKFINNGFANTPNAPKGGGAYNAKLYRCDFIGNRAESGGGAFSSTLYGCVVSNNSAGYDGGGLGGPSAANPCRAYDCTVVSNSAVYGGGANYTTLSNCTVAFNTVTGQGGGARLSTLLNCRVTSNRAVYGGGVGDCAMTNCIVAFNTGIGSGGGGLNGSYYNCLFYGNSSGYYGGGASLADGAQAVNCTFVGNEAYVGGGVGVEGAGPSYVVNSIVYSNNATANASYSEWRGNVTFSNSCVRSEKAGWDSANTTNNPLFLTSGGGYGASHVVGDYHVRPNSPCLNTGLSQSWMAGALDLDGNPRIDKFSGNVDMGAYEFVYQGLLLTIR